MTETLLTGALNHNSNPPKILSSPKQTVCYRPDREIIDDDDYVLNTTPGFRKHVSRKLSEIIDRYSCCRVGELSGGLGVGLCIVAVGWGSWGGGCRMMMIICSEYNSWLLKTCVQKTQ